MAFLVLGANSVSGYTVKNSLRFNSGSSDKLTRTTGTPTSQQKFTCSAWCKRTNVGTFNIIQSFYTDANNYLAFDFLTSDRLDVINYAGATTARKITTAVFRDVSAWYHIVASVDTTLATANDRIKIYVNGTLQTAFDTNTAPSQNANLLTNATTTAIGVGEGGSIGYHNGYISEIYYIDGQALDVTLFGETDTDTGIWKPKAYTGSYGTNGFYLKFANSASLGTDSSGNGNTFTVNNLTSVDQSTDTPTNNFATWNPLNAYNSTTAGTLSEGNLKISGTATDGGIPSTIGVSTGKWYWEVKYTTQSGGDPVLGIISSSGASKMQSANSGSVTSGSGVWCMFNLTSGGVGFQENGVFVSYPSSTLANGDILNIALDVDERKLWFGKNGTWYSSGNPATGANAISTNLTASETWFAYCEKRNGSSVWETNFGNPTYSANSYTDGAGYGNFSYSVPSGYYSLCTKNLANFGF
jgi:hypothetical protein